MAAMPTILQNGPIDCLDRPWIIRDMARNTTTLQLLGRMLCHLLQLPLGFGTAVVSKGLLSDEIWPFGTSLQATVCATIFLTSFGQTLRIASAIHSTSYCTVHTARSTSRHQAMIPTCGQGVHQQTHRIPFCHAVHQQIFGTGFPAAINNHLSRKASLHA